MPRILFGIVKFRTLQARNYWTSLIKKKTFQISVPQHLTHCTPQETDGLFDNALNKNVRLSNVTVWCALTQITQPMFFHILDHVRTKGTLNRVEKFIELERFQSFASELTSLRIQIDSGGETDKAARYFTACHPGIKVCL